MYIFSNLGVLSDWVLQKNSNETPNQLKSNPVSKKFRKLLEKHPVRNFIGLGLAFATISLGFTAPEVALSENPAILEVVSLSEQAIELTTTETVHSPVNSNLVVNQAFHSWHLGVDLKASVDQPIYPIMKGQVVGVYHWQHEYGKHLLIDHGSGLQSLYAHLNQILVKPGDQVSVETIIGLAGATGHATGPHLHLELIDQGKHINPLNLFKL